MTGGSEWRGRVGDAWAAEWRRTDRSLAALSCTLDAAIAAAAPGRAFRALDVGCGAGGTSLALATTRPDAAITGIDLSLPLLAVAHERLPGATFVHGDAVATARAHGPFDLIHSRHGVMFFDDPAAAFAALRDAARASARLVFSCFADWRANAFYADLVAALGLVPPQSGAPGPFAFAEEQHVAAILAVAGWREAAAREVRFDYRAGSSVDDAADFLSHIGPAARALRDAPDEERAGLQARLRDVIAARASGDAVDFPATAWIWTAHA